MEVKWANKPDILAIAVTWITVVGAAWEVTVTIALGCSDNGPLFKIHLPRKQVHNVHSVPTDRPVTEQVNKLSHGHKGGENTNCRTETVKWSKVEIQLDYQDTKWLLAQK